MEYNVEAGPAKYLVGTEQGVVLSINLRKRKSNDCVVPMDMGSGKHHGPIYSIQRNPAYDIALATTVFLAPSFFCRIVEVGISSRSLGTFACVCPCFYAASPSSS